MNTTTATVTIPAATFAADAQVHAALAADYLAATVAADHLPADWTSPGGASAAYLLDFINEDAVAARRDAQDAATYARTAARAIDARVAAQNEHQAAVSRAATKYAAGNTARYLAHLTN